MITSHVPGVPPELSKLEILRTVVSNSAGLVKGNVDELSKSNLKPILTNGSVAGTDDGAT